jgi:WD repeat-containing protein 48
MFFLYYGKNNSCMILQLNIGQETLRGLLAHWLAQKRLKTVAPATANGDAGLNVSSGPGEHGSNRRTGLGDSVEEPHSHQCRVLPSFEFSTQSPPSIITEGSQVIAYLRLLSFHSSSIL